MSTKYLCDGCDVELSGKALLLSLQTPDASRKLHFDYCEKCAFNNPTVAEQLVYHALSDKQVMRTEWRTFH